MNIDTALLREQVTRKFNEDIAAIARFEEMTMQRPIPFPPTTVGSVLGVRATMEHDVTYRVGPGALPKMLTVRKEGKNSQPTIKRGCHNAEAACLRLSEPFTVPDLAAATGLTKGGAGSQIRRWLKTGRLQKVALGKYKRSVLWGGPKVGATRPIERTLDNPASKRPDSKTTGSKYVAACLKLNEPFRAVHVAKATGLTDKAASTQLWRWEGKGLVTNVAPGEFKRTAKMGNSTPAPLPDGRISVPGLDRPDYDHESTEYLEVRLQQAIAERDDAERNGRMGLQRILTDKVKMLQGKISARQG